MLLLSSETAHGHRGEQAERGNLAADSRLSFHTKDVYGNDIDSSIIAGKKLVLVNFWEHWCGRCLEEMPDMERLYRKYQDQGLLFIGVYKRDEDVTDAEALEEITRIGIACPIIQDCAELQLFQNDGWPCTYVFDGDGNKIDVIVDGYQPEDAWETLIIKNLLRYPPRTVWAPLCTRVFLYSYILYERSYQRAAAVFELLQPFTVYIETKRRLSIRRIKEKRQETALNKRIMCTLTFQRYHDMLYITVSFISYNKRIK